MPIKLIENESHNGMSQFVACTVEDFADDAQAALVLEEFCAVVGKDKGSKRRWRREDDACYEVTGGLLRKQGGKKVLDKVEKELRALGFGDHIERVKRTKAELQGGAK